MIKQAAIASFALLGSLVSLGSALAGEDDLRAALEKTWRAHLEASRSGDESEIQKTMSAFRLGTMKNNLAGAGRSLTPEMIRSIAEHAPDIFAADFATLLEKGPTAGLVYVKDSEEEEDSGTPRVSFLFIKFVKEESGWKVDAAMNIGSPKFQDDGKMTEFDPADLPPTYEIDGQLRTAPTPVKPPYAPALLDVFSPGYKTRVTVNGVEQATTVDASHSGLLAGGLCKGENSIVIDIARTEADAASEPRVIVRRILENRETEEVFKFEPKGDIAGTHTLTFMIAER